MSRIFQNAARFTATVLNDINNRGEIVGYLLEEDCKVHGFGDTGFRTGGRNSGDLWRGVLRGGAPLDLQESSSEREGMRLES